MHILYLTTGFPFPLISGRLRQFHFIKQLSRHHDVTLVALVGKDFGEEEAKAVGAIVKRLIPVTGAVMHGGLVTKLFRHASMVLTGTTPDYAAMRRVVIRLMKEHPADAVFFSVSTMPALEGLVLPPLVADVCDAEQINIRNRMKHAPLSQIPKLQMALMWADRVLAKVSARSSHLMFASRRDLEAAVGDSLESATVVANGVDVEYWKRTAKTLGTRSIVFTGNMKYPPNTDCAMLLIHEIMPIVRHAVGDAHLYIVGHSPTPELVEAGKSHPGVTVTGMVDDVRPYLDQAAVFAAPLRFGAGIQNKLLEAMAMELPVLTTQLAADGLLPGGELLPPVEVFETPQEFAAAILRHLAAREQDPSPDPVGRRFVMEHFTWEGSGIKLENVLNRVAVDTPLPVSRAARVPGNGSPPGQEPVAR
jgi:polysaccharide biosynthesis protein PslH